jgi:enoyl-[acyl-carrier protein] reductase I
VGLLDGKKGLIIGMANAHSLSWGIAQALCAEGATLGFTYRSTSRERRIRPLVESLGQSFIERCDVQNDDDIAALMVKARERFGTLDIIIHAPASARPEELRGRYLETTRAGFQLALDVSAYSLTAIVRAAEPLLNPGASIVTLTYLGSERIVPNYNVAGVAKAALEASVRYLAYDLGPQQIRVNAISAGPIRTLAASGIADFRALHRSFAALAPLRRHITIDDVGRTALWLCSDWSSAVTGETIYVDAGAHHLAYGGTGNQQDAHGEA